MEINSFQNLVPASFNENFIYFSFLVNFDFEHFVYKKLISVTFLTQENIFYYLGLKSWEKNTAIHLE